MNKVVLNYLYRDAGNYKNHMGLVFENANNLPVEDLNRQFRETLQDGEDFVAEQVGLPTCYSEFIDADLDHGYHEYGEVLALDPDRDSAHLVPGNGDISELLERFRSAATEGWKLDQDRMFEIMDDGHLLDDDWNWDPEPHDSHNMGP